MIRYGFFASVDDDRAHDDTFLADMLASFIGNGVYYSQLQVVAGTGMEIILKAGKCWINGRYMHNDSDLPIQLENADGVLNRYASIMLRADLTGRVLTPVVVYGDFASEAQPPEPVRNAEIYDLRRAYISIPAGATEITQAQITDRLGFEDCPIVTNMLGDFDAESLFAQLAAEIAYWNQYYSTEVAEWLETIKGILDEETATHLLNLIVGNENTATVAMVGGELVITPTAGQLGTRYELKFDAAADYDAETPVKISGDEVVLLDSSGGAITGQAWKTGDYVHLRRNGAAAIVLSPLANMATKAELQEVGDWLIATDVRPTSAWQSTSRGFEIRWNKHINLMIITGAANYGSSGTTKIPYNTNVFLLPDGFPKPSEEVRVSAGIILGTSGTDQQKIPFTGRISTQGYFTTGDNTHHNMTMDWTGHTGDWVQPQE